MKKNLKKFVLILLAAASTAPLAASELSFSVYLDLVTKYLWRGQLLYHGMALQPGVDVSSGNLNAGFWGSVNLGTGELGEADITVSYSESAPYLNAFTLSAGFTLYTFPNGTDPGNHSTEVFAGILADVISAPYLTFYYDVEQGAGCYLEAGISHGESLGPVDIEGSASIGYNYGQWEYNPSFSVVLAGLSGSWSIEGLTISLSVTGQLALQGQYENDMYGSIGFSYSK